MNNESLLYRDVEIGRAKWADRGSRHTMSLSHISTAFEGDPEQLASYGSVKFKWNNRWCRGTDFHMNVLMNYQEEVIQQLAAGTANIDHRFVYSTIYEKRAQPCTGCAIHLAASRGHKELVQILLDRDASVDSKVQRDGKDHYDVMHAAVFMEGRGGSGEMINFLVSNGADIDSLNLNEKGCLHLAFQTGNLKTIDAVRHARKMKGLQDEEDKYDDCDLDFDCSGRKETPLELGIQVGKMSKEMLARAAPPNISSLKVFIHRAPECIPQFIKRLSAAKGGTTTGQANTVLSKMLADKLSHKDIARLLREYPKAAVALLNSVTANPVVTSPGWHPLPSRVSFAARSYILQLMKNFVPSRRFLCFYETDHTWSFCDQAYEAPAWHNKLTGHKAAPVIDADIKVCYIPNIISPNIFSALLARTDGEDPALFLYEALPVRAAVSYTFWNGAIWVDVLQFLISFWGLALLVLETCFKHEAAVGRDGKYLDWQMNEGVFEPSFVARSHRNGVVADWIIAKGIVDLWLEIAQMWGCVLIGEIGTYANLGNLWDLTRSIVPILLLWGHENRLLHLMIVLIYWMRLLEGVTYSEKIGHALLPLQKLATGLLPAMTFTLVGFCALTHAMYTVQVRADHLWPETLFHTFTTLITQGLPENPPEDGLELLVLYGGVLFFSVFVLNIFIGVIGEQYSNEKAQVSNMFISVRASSCLTYLLRICVFPCNLLTSHHAAIIAALCVAATIAIQVLALFFGRQLPGLYQLFAFVACQMITFIATIQCKGSEFPWTDRSLCQNERTDPVDGSSSSKPDGYAVVGSRSGKKRYLWICEPRDADFQTCGSKQSSVSRCGSMTFEGTEKATSSDSLDGLDRVGLTQMIRDAVRQELGDAKDLLAGSRSSGTRSRMNTDTNPRHPTLLTSSPIDRDMFKEALSQAAQ